MPGSYRVRWRGLFLILAGRSRVMSQRTPSRSCFLVTFLLISGCASSPVGDAAAASAPCPDDKAAGLVLVADGAGNFCAASTSLAHVVEEAHAPLCVRPFIWSHGY